jgi:hypothetical protein
MTVRQRRSRARVHCRRSACLKRRSHSPIVALAKLEGRGAAIDSNELAGH